MFKKYSSIENHYRNKFIGSVLEKNPELNDIQYVIQEKIDGACIQLYFEPNKEFLVGKRSEFLGSGANFYDIWNVLKKYDEEIKRIQDGVNALGVGASLRLYGEIFGQGVQNRINYGKEKQIKFYDAEVNGIPATQKDFWKLSVEFEIHHLLVPCFGSVNGLEKAMDFDVENHKTGIFTDTGLDKGFIEGVVIKPYDRVIYDFHGQRFAIKKKSEKFEEKMKSNKPPRESKVFAPEVHRLREEFATYINDNRLKSVFSKEGTIQDHSEIGKFIKLLMEDAISDFKKDHPEVESFDKSDFKTITNMGGQPFNLIKGYL